MHRNMSQPLCLVGAVLFAGACAQVRSSDKSSSQKANSAADPAGTAAVTGEATAEFAADGRPGPGHPSVNTADGHHVPGPSLADWKPEFPSISRDAIKPEDTQVALVTSLELPLYGRMGDRWAIGYAFMGNRLSAKTTGKSCKDGEWLEVVGAYACTGDGVRLASPKEAVPPEDVKRRPNVDAASPYLYVKARDGGPPLLKRIPTADELTQVLDGKNPGGVVDIWMNGNYLLALARKVEAHGKTFWATVEGRYVLADDLIDRPTPPMHGGRVTPGEFPVAFAMRDTKLACNQGDKLTECGTVGKHARVTVAGKVTRSGKDWLLIEGNRAVPADDMRVADKVDRPDGVDASDKWIHINLSEQTLVAYEGDKPVFATLISSGLRNHATKNGLFKMQRKYVAKTMRGQDEDGPYVVEQVPWTMFYDGLYAVHGAYWHNNFGNTRSHGCVNVPPANARWLYHWSDPGLPAAWHSMFHRLGTHVYITGQTPPDVEQPAG